MVSAVRLWVLIGAGLLAVTACEPSVTRTGFHNPVNLATNFAKGVNPPDGLLVTSVTCKPSGSSVTNFTCTATLSDGTLLAARVVVSFDGKSWTWAR